jgi:hypothetical protein
VESSWHGDRRVYDGARHIGIIDQNMDGFEVRALGPRRGASRGSGTLTTKNPRWPQSLPTIGASPAEMIDPRIPLFSESRAFFDVERAATGRLARRRLMRSARRLPRGGSIFLGGRSSRPSSSWERIC